MQGLQVNVKQFEEQITARLSLPKDKWSWHVERILSDHILIRLYLTAIEPGRILPVVLSKDGAVSIWEGRDHSEFARLIEEERLTIADNLQDILDIFCFFHPYKKILQSVADLEKESLSQEKLPLLSRYAKSIGPPTAWFGKSEQRASFWTIDYGFGNLEEWLFVQRGTRLHIQSWTREKYLILTLLGH
jgi:hypothetical protein